MHFSSLGNLSTGIDQLRTCERCHRLFPILSDLFNHMCDDDDDDGEIRRREATKSSGRSTRDYSSFNHTRGTPPLEKPFSASSTQGSSARSFKLNRHSSFNESPRYSTSIRLSPVNRPMTCQSSSTSVHIPPLFRPTEPKKSTFRLSSPSLVNDNQQQHASRAYVYLRQPSSPMRLVS